jgi:hypothetical protein
MAGFSRGGGHRQTSCKRWTRRSRLPSMVFADLRGCIDLWVSNQTRTWDDLWETGDLDLQVINPQVFPQVFLWVLTDHRDSCWSLEYSLVSHSGLGFCEPAFPEIQHFCWANLEEVALLTLKSFHSLTDLHLSFCNLDNFDQVVNMICPCSMPLDSLTVSGTIWGSSNMLIIDLPSPPSLWHLSLSSIGNDVSDCLLLHEQAYKRIQTFHVHVNYPEEMIIASKILEVLGPSLRHLMLQIDTDFRGTQAVVLPSCMSHKS